MGNPANTAVSNSIVGAVCTWLVLGVFIAIVNHKRSQKGIETNQRERMLPTIIAALLAFPSPTSAIIATAFVWLVPVGSQTRTDGGLTQQQRNDRFTTWTDGFQINPQWYLPEYYRQRAKLILLDIKLVEMIDLFLKPPMQFAPAPAAAQAATAPVPPPANPPAQQPTGVFSKPSAPAEPEQTAQTQIIPGTAIRH